MNTVREAARIAGWAVLPGRRHLPTNGLLARARAANFSLELRERAWVIFRKLIAMTYLEAAIAVLQGTSRPMTVGEITEAALRKGLIEARGKTPEASMSAALYGYVRDAEASVIRREFRAGTMRAVRGSVRWSYRR